MASKGHPCEFCKRTFAEEGAFINHACEKKRRWMNRDLPAERMAFVAWSRFYELSQARSGANTKRSHREFIDSRYYQGFLRFGRYIVDINMVSPGDYVDYVIRANIPLDKWISDQVYRAFLEEFTRKEQPERALERMIRIMQDWAGETGSPWHEFFREVSPNHAIHLIQAGRISPWVLYNSQSAVDLLDRCTPEQLAIITSWAPVPQWKIRFNKHPEEVRFIRETLESAGV
jgi:hypothetical protein